MNEDEIKALEALGYVCRDLAVCTKTIDWLDLVVYKYMARLEASVNIGHWAMETDYPDLPQLLAALPRHEADARAVAAVVGRQEGCGLVVEPSGRVHSGADAKNYIASIAADIIKGAWRGGAIEALKQLEAKAFHTGPMPMWVVPSEEIRAALTRLREEGETDAVPTP